MLAEHREEKRVRAALRDHTLAEVIAAAADVPLQKTLSILESLARQGVAERYTADTWGLR